MDERGFFCELFREDWKELTREDKIVQTSLSVSRPGVVRAWHRHRRGQIDYLVVLRGVVKVGVFDEMTEGLEEVILKGENPQILRIDGRYWHGTKNVGSEDSWTLYMVTKLYDYQDPDEERLPPNSEKIVDPRTQKPYEW
jgi:dTDP-4-dehydrorhamnose 3,5-epimerase